jgi:tetratricopeptide (TPR) repeat protein
LFIQRGEADRGLGYAEQALTFYQPGGYRTETSQALLLRGRAYKQKGDYNAALQSFQDQLKLAEQTGDQAQIAYSQGSIGNLLFDQESFAEARPHVEKSYGLYKSMGNQLYQGYASLNLGATLWWLGQNDEARRLLGEASDIAKQKGSSYSALQAAISLVEAQIALSERHYPEAEAHSRQALDLAGAEDKFVAVQGKYLMGLSQVLGGRAPAGQALCRQASDAAVPLGDPLLIAKSQLALAEAALAAGDAKTAIDAAKHAQTFFVGAGLSESNWRAWLIAGMASQKANDQNNAQVYLTSAVNGLSSLQQKWGEQVFKSYVARPDIQVYRRNLEQSSAARR